MNNGRMIYPVRG